MSTEAEVTKILDRISSYYGPDRFKLSPALVHEWSRAFRACPYFTLERAFSMHLQESTRIVTLADMMQLALSCSGGSFGQKRDSVHHDDEMTKAVMSFYERTGLRKVTEYGHAAKSISYYRKESALVNYRGRFIPKIDYVLEVLGPQIVNREIKSITGGRTLSSLVSSAGWIDAYRKKLDELILKASSMDGDQVQLPNAIGAAEEGQR